ncbi:MAG: hypothetical protein ACXWLH_04060 [Candidatus Saccharimonadales bacterium]
MKQKDIMLIVVVVIISTVASVLISKMLITSPKNRQQKVEVVQPISPDFAQPDPKYFNNKSIDPTQLIQIGGGSNQQPFSGN